MQIIITYILIELIKLFIYLHTFNTKYASSNNNGRGKVSIGRVRDRWHNPIGEHSAEGAVW